MALEQRRTDIYFKNTSDQPQVIKHRGIANLTAIPVMPGGGYVHVVNGSATIQPGQGAKVPMVVWNTTPSLMNAFWTQEISEEEYSKMKSKKEKAKPILIVDDIAKACHEANRAYCLQIGDDSQVAWEDAPEWQRQSCMSGVDLIIESPDTTPEMLHQNWLQYKVEGGWTFGDIKDEVAKTHPCLVPYAELPDAQKAKDAIFQSVARTLIKVAGL
ncbi:MAG: RyR domain-containing protein [Armatimonadota bacterium]